jgi:uncharacterized protein YkwD
MKGILCSLTLVVAACGGDDGGMTTTDANNNSMIDAPGGVNEPPELTGITAAHNTVRAMVDTTGIAAGPLPPMVWDSAIAAHAKAWAEMCIDMDGNGLVDHSSSAYRQQGTSGFSYLGENIFASSASPASATQAVQVWAQEKANFTYPSGCSGVCGHYTQVVWRDSTHLGCANITCNGLQYKGVVLCEYGPGGNSGGAPY